MTQLLYGKMYKHMIKLHKQITHPHQNGKPRESEKESLTCKKNMKKDITRSFFCCLRVDRSYLQPTKKKLRWVLRDDFAGFLAGG